MYCFKNRPFHPCNAAERWKSELIKTVLLKISTNPLDALKFHENAEKRAQQLSKF